MIRLRAFRAVDEEDSCYEFANGHKKVLEGFNLGNITTNNVSWAYNPNVYVIMAHDTESGDLLGGIRIQIADGIHPLPVEDAVSNFDPKIHDMVNHYALSGGTSELCGLWNSRSKAPNIGITINLVVAGMAICNQLPITSIFTIVASYTLKIARQMGYRVETSLGNNGEFIYPNSNYVARVLSMNPITLEHSFAMYKEKMIALRENPNLRTIENVRDNQEVIYIHDLSLKKVGSIEYSM